VQTEVKAWQPVTPSGVAAFSRSSLRRLLLLQLLVAALAGGVVAWFLFACWFPTVRAALQHLPSKGEIRVGTLNWPGPSPALLADGPFLAFSVDLDHSGRQRSPAHVQCEFGRKDVRIYSLFGYAAFPYPKQWIIAFNRPELEPWWGAWEPLLLWLAAAGTAGGLMAVWTMLATVYCGPLWLIAYFANRQLNLVQSWKLAGAALLPGALLETVAVAGYGLGHLDLVKLTVVTAVHFLVGWVYALLGVLASPVIPAGNVVRGNPFAAGEDSVAPEADAPRTDKAG
jgi:hypothetical protein